MAKEWWKDKDWLRGGRGFRAWKTYKRTETSGSLDWLHVAADIGDRVNSRVKSGQDISVRIAPNATAASSGAPAHFDARRRELVVDSMVALPGQDPKKVRYTSRQWQNRNLRAVGLVEHELGHAIHSTQRMLTSMQAPGVTELATVLALRLEESRMEAQHVRISGGRQDAFRAAASELILQRWEGNDDSNIMRLALNMIPVLGRQVRLHSCGCLTDGDVAPMRAALVGRIGEKATLRLESLLSHHNGIQNDALERYMPADWNALADTLRDILDQAEPESPETGEGEQGESEQSESEPSSSGGTSDESEGKGTPKPQPDATPNSESTKTVREMIEDSQEGIRDDVKRKAAEADAAQDTDDEQRRKNPPVIASHRSDIEQDQWKEPVTVADRKLASALRQNFRHLAVPAITRKHRNRIDPPGRLRGRGAIDRDAQAAAGAVPTAEPWSRTQKLMDKAPPPVIGIMLDVSGSMSGQARPVASLAWSLSEAARSAQLKTALVTFGNQGRRIIHDPRNITITDCDTGGFENTIDAFPRLDAVLHLTRPARGNRVLIVVTDLGIGNTNCNGYFAAVLRHLERLEVTVLWAVPESDMGDVAEYARRFGFEGIGSYVPLPADATEQAGAIAAAIMRAVA